MSDMRENIAKRVRLRGTARHVAAALSVVAIAVVVALLCQIGIAITSDRTQLSCTYSATDAHAHDESCYRNGSLVCPVPEREAHRHSDACYAEEKVLACEHGGEAGHTHDESCYRVERTLSCGLDETTGPHVHTSACYPAGEAAEPDDSESMGAAASPEGEARPAQSFEGTLQDDKGIVLARVLVDAPEGAFPAGTEMRVSQLPAEEAKGIDAAVAQSVEQKSGGKVLGSRAMDISFFHGGREIEPAGEVAVRISSDGMHPEGDAPYLVHIDENGQGETKEPLGAEELAQRKLAPAPEGSGEMVFAVSEFSPYVIVVASTDQHLSVSDGSTFDTLSVDAGAAAGIPSGTGLRVTEILPGSDGYDAYAQAARERVGRTDADVRIYDISLVSESGAEVQPQEPVTVSIDMAGKGVDVGPSAEAVHFGAAGPELLGAAVSGSTVSFAASGFSVYAVVPDDSAPQETVPVVSAGELARLYSEGVLLSVNRDSSAPDVPYYMTAGINDKGAVAETVSPSAAATWFFEPVEGADGRCRLYASVDGGRLYLRGDASVNANGAVLSPEGGDEFEVVQVSDGVFRLRKPDASVKSGFRWLQHVGNGKGIMLSPTLDTGRNSQFTMTYASSFDFPDDPYGLAGSSFGIAHRNGETNAYGLMSNLSAGELIIRPDIIGIGGSLLASGNAPVTQWTFESAGRDLYRLSTPAGDATKYLSLNSNGKLALASEASDSSLIRVVPGTGANDGLYQFRFEVGDVALQLSGTTWNTTASLGAQGAWHALVYQVEDMADSDFVTYAARKVSVSDASLSTGARLVLYTRIWNDASLRYDYYAVSGDGSLFPVAESGNEIKWIGSTVNPAVWEFTEYLSDGKPNYYYELRNVLSGQYLAPQIGGGQILSDRTIGLNLNGRRYGDDYTTILAWDDPYYEYAGISVEDGHIRSCSLSQAQDFFFAVIDDADGTTGHPLTEVETLSNSEYGIEMRMIDYTGTVTDGREATQVSVLGEGKFLGWVETKGLLSPYLEDNGYPMTNQAVTDRDQTSLEALYGSKTTPADNLFLKATHDENGYFEYDSTQNAAKLNADGRFTVYGQLAAIGTSTGTTRTHGQFMPYNTIYPDVMARVTNKTNIRGNELPDSDPRKREGLHLIPDADADYHFGMEMRASFAQTPDGLDAWGHDIIFEFSGDDDFWLYVDGMLVLDLGGVHSAMDGSINFRTGKVINNGQVTNLREMFRTAYSAKNPSATEEEVDRFLDETFKDGGSVFKDYTIHDMTMFYMERGAGASNLHMKFNLAAAKPDTVVLSKTISGTTAEDYSLAEFPYQIWYTTKEDGESARHILTDKVMRDGREVNSVTVSGRNVPMPYERRYVPTNGSVAYEHVFFLRPGQAADVQFPEGTVDYGIVECGLNTGIYDAVKVNGSPVDGSATADPGRADYKTDAATIADRPRVTYDNHVNPSALRTLTIGKVLHDVEGREIHDDPTGFTFRLLLADERGTLTLADMYPYLVRDGSGSYCRRDHEQQRFVPIGKSDWNALTDEERQAVTFYTSVNGSISKIPAGYSVEVRELIVGAKFAVQERDSDMPEGYALDRFERVDGSYITEGGEPNTGVIRDNSDPSIVAHNRRGWGITAKKNWSDADFMDGHDTIFMALYLRGELLRDTVQALPSGKTSLYWFLDRLADGAAFSDYDVREVTLGGDFSAQDDVASNGRVTLRPGTQVTPISEGGTLSAGAVPQGGERQLYSYLVGYEKGDATGAGGFDNVRTDTVTNARSGIRIMKADWQGHALAGATFKITDTQGRTVGNESYTSDESGLVTVAYLPDGRYSLIEVSAPSGFRGIDGPVTIEKSGESVTVGGDDQTLAACSYDPDATLPTLTVRNRDMHLSVTKTDTDGTPLGGAAFALYRQVEDSDGNLRPDLVPMPGYEWLVSGNALSEGAGLIPKIDETLPRGTYYLREVSAAPGYFKLPGDLCLSVGATGAVSIQDNPGWGIRETRDGDAVSYAISVTNIRKTTSVSVTKAWEGGAPERASATMRLFSYLTGSSPSEAAPVDDADDVTLPVEGDAPWVARFDALPKYDAEGREIHYVVREVSCLRGYEPSYQAGDEARDGETITNRPAPQDFMFEKQWVGIAERDVWPEGTTITVDITRALVTDDGRTVGDAGFKTTYALTANKDGSDPRVTLAEGTSAPLAIDGSSAMVEWDAEKFVLRSLPTRGRLGDDSGTWAYAVSERSGDGLGYVATYRLHGAPLEGATSVGNGGTIVNETSLIKTYRLPESGGGGTQGGYLAALSIASPAVAYAACKVLRHPKTGRRE